MSRVTTSHWITKYILLSLVCFDSVFSATIETAQTMEDDDAEDIYLEDEISFSEYEDILRNDFIRFTTRKRYIWEDYTVPTRDYSGYGGGSGNTDFLLYVFIPIFAVVFIATAVYICVKNVQSENCCSFGFDDSDSTDRFTTVHRPPQRRRDLTAQVHRPPTGRNPVVNISFADSSFASVPRGRVEPDIAIGERPPDYSTVTLNDLINPNQPAFPVIRKGNETPPPEYGKENPLYK